VIIPFKFKALAAGAVVLGFFFTGWHIRDRFAEAEVAILTSHHTAVINNLNVTHRDALLAETNRRLTIERARIQDINILDTKYTEELNNAKLETENALAAVAAGELRLRNRFTCNSAASASGAGVATSPGASVDNAGEKGGLQGTDAAFLVRLASEADAVVTQLRACQAVIAGDRQ